MNENSNYLTIKNILSDLEKEKHNLVFKSMNDIEYRDNFFNICGFPHYENVVSNILQYFFDKKNNHELDDLFLKSFLNILNKKLGKNITLDNQYSIVREEYDKDNKKRIDIVIIGNEYVISIENKIRSNDSKNPYLDYKKHLQNVYKNKKIIIVLLSIYQEKSNCEIEGIIDCCIKYDEFLKEIEKNIKDYKIQSNLDTYTLLRHFINNLKHEMNYKSFDKNTIDLLLEEEKDSIITNSFETISIYKKELLNELGKKLENEYRDKISYYIWPNKYTEDVLLSKYYELAVNYIPQNIYLRVCLSWDLDKGEYKGGINSIFLGIDKDDTNNKFYPKTELLKEFKYILKVKTNTKNIYSNSDLFLNDKEKFLDKTFEIIKQMIDEIKDI